LLPLFQNFSCNLYWFIGEMSPLELNPNTQQFYLFENFAWLVYSRISLEMKFLSSPFLFVNRENFFPSEKRANFLILRKSY